MAFLSHLRTIEDLAGPAGRLEALLNTGLDDSPCTALVAHPHPPSGGTMHNKVIYHTMKAFTAFGVPVLRFNFRGVGASHGIHDEGRGEVDDTRAAVDYLERTFARPILFAGFSFGSNIGFRACCGDPRVAGLVGLGLPVRAAGRDYHYRFLPQCSAPKLFVSGDHDEFCPQDVLDELLTTATSPWERHIVTGADHFFQGIAESPKPKLDIMQAHLRSWLTNQIGLQPL